MYELTVNGAFLNQQIKGILYFCDPQINTTTYC